MRAKDLNLSKTHVKKNVDDFGRFCAKIFGTPVGWFTRSGKEAIIPDTRVTTKKPFCHVY